MGFEDFLQSIVVLINEANNQRRIEIVQREADRISNFYYGVNREDLFRRLHQELEQDVELYYLVLFAIYFVVKDPKCLEVMECLLFHRELDIFVAENIIFQLKNFKFRDINIPVSYRKEREINEYLLNRYLEEYPINIPFLPYAERNKRRIIVATNTLMEIVHAPSRVVLDVCKILQRELKYEVMLIVNVANPKLARMQQYCLFPYITCYKSELNGKCTVEYAGEKISTYQIMWNQNSIPDLQKLLQEIYDWKPLCVWYIGGSSFVQDIYSKIITEISMPCTDGYSVSEAPVMLSYMKSDSEYIKESMDYIKGKEQKTYNVQMVIEHKDEGKNYRKEDFGFPKDCFLICIVGTRLDSEMSLEFIDMIQEIVKEQNIYLMVIGKCKEDRFPDLERDKVKYLGMRIDLVDVIKVADLFVNPPRKGGGGGAARAIAMGVPVVSLKGCDVANVIGTELCCLNLDEMRQKIVRCRNDECFYNENVKKTLERHCQRVKESNAVSYNKMLEQVKDWLSKGEIL